MGCSVAPQSRKSKSKDPIVNMMREYIDAETEREKERADAAQEERKRERDHELQVLKILMGKA